MTDDVARGRWYPDMPPALPGETDDQYTNRLTGADRTGRVPYDHRRFRQCSIGWHNECSDPAGEECKCPCHSDAPPAAAFTELYLDAGELTLLIGLLRTDIDSVQATVALAQSEEVRTLLKARVVMAMSLHTAFSEAHTSVAPNITCPRCGMTSYNPTDVVEGYCGNCHEWTRS